MLIKLKRKYKKEPLTSAFDAYQIMREIFMDLDTIERNKEHFWVMGLSNGYNLKYIDLVSIGSLTGVAIGIQELFTHAIRFGGIGKIIVVHNHPSGNTTPSGADKKITEQVMAAGKILQIEVVDHLIITPRSYYSFNGVKNAKGGNL